MSDVTVSLTDSIDPALQSAISDGLGSYNAEMGGARDRKPLAIAINGPDGTPLGGLVGRTSMGLLFIDCSICRRSCAARGSAAVS